MSHPTTTVFSLALIAALLSPCGTAVQAGKQTDKPAIHGILYNEDDSNRFVLDPAGTMKPERLDRLVDDLADSEVSVLLICCCAKKTAFDGKAWEPQCRGFDPAKDDSQPYFDGLATDARKKGVRRWAHNQRMMFDANVDPVGRMIQRCRQRHISPWVSIRMNDAHDAPLLKSPLHSRFWTEHPEYWRVPDLKFAGSWFNRCLNYGLEPVRDHAMALVREVCDRYDMDGLELDWNRFPLHFRAGEEIEKGKLLTEWLVEVRKVVRAAERKWKHPIRLVARVPARPEVSLGSGLDAVSWARRGLIDHLVVAPFFTSTDFDIPVERWLKLLDGTGVGVTVGLETRVQSYPGGPLLTNTPELRRGAAMAALSRGSQGIYVFNYFDVPTKMPKLLREMHSVDAMRGKDRDYAITFVDINVPGQTIRPELPKQLAPGTSADFRLFIGPKPIAGARGEVHLTLSDDKPNAPRPIQVTVNGQPLNTAKRPISFPGAAFRAGYNSVHVTNTGQRPLTIKSVQLAVRFPGQP